MPIVYLESIPEVVLPLTREWIEICCYFGRYSSFGFSLLRGSGLKFNVPAQTWHFEIVLPLTREWIEMNWKLIGDWYYRCSPSYEGVD